MTVEKDFLFFLRVFLPALSYLFPCMYVVGPGIQPGTSETQYRLHYSNKTMLTRGAVLLLLLLCCCLTPTVNI